MRGFLITATDTAVGKTIFTAALAERLRETGHDVVALKPFASGAIMKDGRRVSADALFLESAAQSNEPLDVVNPVLLDNPLAPAVASRIESREIDVAAVVRQIRETAGRHELTLVEGVGGLHVPITDDALVTDFACELGLALIVVARPNLGTINHTSMTIACARARGLHVAGVVISGYPSQPGLAEQTNPAEIERLTNVPILAILPYSAGTDTDTGVRGPQWPELLAAIDPQRFLKLL